MRKGTRAASWPGPLDPGVLASLLLHALLGLGLFFIWAPRLPAPPPEHSIEVEIIEGPRRPPIVQPDPVSPSLPAAPAEPSPSPSIESSAASPPQDAVTQTRSAPEMVTPTQMLSAKMLANPRSRYAQKMLRLLAGYERIEQLCDIEAMAQVAAWKKTFQPDRLVAYAMSDTKLSGNAIIADGAAFHSKGKWFNIKFRCDLTPDRKKVVSFAFAVGAAVPRSEWSTHSLPFEDGPSD